MERSRTPNLVTRRHVLLVALIPLLSARIAVADVPDAPHILYTSPAPGARYIRPASGLIIRFDRELAASAALPAPFRVSGSQSGDHPGLTRIARDHRTVLFQPAQPFQWGERVEVALGASRRLEFSIAAAPVPVATALAPLSDDPLDAWRTSRISSIAPASVADTIESGYPPISTTVYGTPAPGRVFLASFPLGSTGTPYLMIVGNAGGPVFARAASQFCTDFKAQPDGRLTYYDTSTSKFYVMDDQYTVIDSFTCGNEFFTDLHELRLLPNGHALLMGIDLEIVDMSAVVPGGNPAASVSGLVIQELDEDKNVIFQWRSWDHFQITDATHEDLTAASIDYVHGNALEVDTDGNLLLSSRHMDEITKIDRTTGDVIWRWGGKNNQFTLLGDTLWFSHQHAIRRIANGHVTLFDNGNFHTPPFSRAAEYALDETNKTAQLVWQYRNTPDTYGNAMGYVQRLNNGSTLISWGTGKPDMIEVGPGGAKVMSLSLPAGIASYRMFREDWGAGLATATPPRPVTLSLTAPQPNPFRSEATLFVNLPSPTGLLVRVADLQGRELKGVARTIAEGTGMYRIRVDLSGRPAGVYFCRVTSAFGDQTRRLVHLN